jgi:hypothetical protein
MRRIIIIGTALAMLVGAAVAYAAFNNYSGSKLSFSPSGAGTKAKPLPIGMVENLKANAPAGDRAAPLTDIKLTIYGAQTNGGDFPKCTDAMITANTTKYDKACPTGSEIGTGPVHALLGSGSSPATAGSVSCNTFLHVYNGSPKTQVFFFTTSNATDCAGLVTGSTAPYDGHISHQGKNLVIDVPLPADISTKVAGHPNFYGSLITEVLTFPKSTKKAHGRTEGYMESVACSGHKRPYSIKFTATKYGGGTETQTVSGAAKC